MQNRVVARPARTASQADALAAVDALGLLVREAGRQAERLRLAQLRHAAAPAAG